MASGCGANTSFRPLPPEGAPDVFFITLDDLGWKTLPRYGNTNIQTPTIDDIADRGATFTRAFNASSSCSSSRATFVTGQHVASHGVNGLVHRFPDGALSTARPTVARTLFHHGYDTVHFGKWHASLNSPRLHGYAFNLNDDDGRTEHIEYPNKILDILDRRGERPVYFELNFLATHLRPGGSFPNDREFEVDPDAVTLLDTWTMPDWPEIRAMAAAYFSQVRRVDAVLRHVFEAQDAQGRLENTLIVITSDNGAPFPGNKRTLHDRGTGTPLIVSWPDGFDGKQSIDALVSSIDIAPTLLAAADAPPLGTADGRSLLGRLRGDDEADYDAAVFSAIDSHAEYTPMRSIRTDRYRLIRSYGDTPIGLGQLDDLDWARRLVYEPNQRWNDPLPAVGLYDLEADPHEQTNLAESDAHADVLMDLWERLEQHLAATDDPLAGA